MKNLLKAGHIRKVDKIMDDIIYQTVFLTVKKDLSVTKALDARSPNNAIRKYKHQMPNFESLMDKVAEIMNDNKEREVLFTSLEMQYAYGQSVLHPETAKQRNFRL